jgi:copper chaperone NosL
MKRSMVFVILCGIASLVVLTNCQKKTIEPVSVEANDMCSFCRMSISEKRYVAEFIDDDGQVLKFDDIGCMASFVQQKKNRAPIRATFVMDFDAREWLKAEDAFYVRSSEFDTPMGFGIVAFKDQTRAQAEATKNRGTMLRFSDVMK